MTNVDDRMDSAEEIIFCIKTHAMVFHVHTGLTEFCGLV